jgi:hypothetical protein
MILRSPPTKIVAAAACAFASAWAITVTAVVEAATSPALALQVGPQDKRTLQISQPLDWRKIHRRKRSRRLEEGEAANDEGTANADDDDAQEEEVSVYERGYLQAQGCASYTISLDEDGQNEYEQNPGVSVVGQETFLFFEYVLPYDNGDDDDAVDDDDRDADENDSEEDKDGSNSEEDNSKDKDRNRRNLKSDDSDENENQENNYYGDDGTYYYGANAMLAKDWLVAFSSSKIETGCIEMEHDMGVFREVVQGIEDGSLSFSNLYYGPICSSNNSNSSAVFEMGIFLDSSCNAYVPGLSQVLNQIILTGWTTGLSFRGGNNRNNNNGDHQGENKNSFSYSRYYNTSGDLQNLDSFESHIRKLNYFHNHRATNCETYPEICQDVSEASVDLSTCHSLASDLWDYYANGDSANYGDGASMEDDQTVDENANQYGEYVSTETNNESDEQEETYDSYHYQMHQQVLEDYAYCAATSYDDDGCSGWSYGWGNYDCLHGNDDGENAYYNYKDGDCHEGVCFAVLESSSAGYGLDEWLEAKQSDLEYELTYVYGVEKPSLAFWYGLMASCGIVLVSVILLACWANGVLKSFFRRQQRRPRGLLQKKEPFLDKSTTTSSQSSKISRSSRSSSGRSISSSSIRFPPELELAPTSSSLSSVPPPPPVSEERDESIEVIGFRIGYQTGKGHIPMGLSSDI